MAAKKTARQPGKVRVQPGQPAATELSRDQISDGHEDPQGRRQRRDQAGRSDSHSPCNHREARYRPDRDRSTTGLFLRHAEPRPEQGRRGRAGKTHPGRRGRHCRQAATGRPGRDRQGTASLGELQDGDRRRSGRIRLLRVVQGTLHGTGGEGRCRRQDAARLPVLEGAAGLLQQARPEGHRTSFAARPTVPRSCSRRGSGSSSSIAGSSSKCGCFPMAPATSRSP